GLLHCEAAFSGGNVGGGAQHGYDRSVQRQGPAAGELQNGFSRLPRDPLQPLHPHGRRVRPSNPHRRFSFQPAAGGDANHCSRDLVEETGSVKSMKTFIGLCLLFPAAAATAQTIVQSFDGDKGPGLAACESGITHCDRPEMNIGVNGKQVVQVTWQNVRIYDYQGHLLESTPMSTFIRKAGLDPTPPERPGQANPNPANTPGPL